MGTALNEYVTILAQSGILGLGVFMFPFLWVITKLLILCRRRNEKQIDILVILLALISCFVAGCNLSINLFYSIWVVLGIAYAIIYSEKDCLNSHDKRESTQKHKI